MEDITSTHFPLLGTYEVKVIYCLLSSKREECSSLDLFRKYSADISQLFFVDVSTLVTLNV